MAIKLFIYIYNFKNTSERQELNTNINHLI